MFFDRFQRFENIESVRTENEVKRRIDIHRIQTTEYERTVQEAERINLMTEPSSENPCGKVHILPSSFTPRIIVGEIGRLEETFKVSTRMNIGLERKAKILPSVTSVALQTCDRV